MEAKKILERYAYMDAEIDLRLEQLETLRKKAEKIIPRGRMTGVRLSEHVRDITKKIGKLEEDINYRIDSLIDYRTAVEKRLSEIEDDALRQLLELKYINKKTLEQISEIMNYSTRQIIRKHKAALERFEHVIECHK